MSLLSPLLFSGSITDLDNEIEKLPFNLAGGGLHVHRRQKQNSGSS